MSALGHKQTSETPANNVRLTPNSGHQSVWAGMSAKCHKRTSAMPVDDPRSSIRSGRATRISAISFGQE